MPREAMRMDAFVRDAVTFDRFTNLKAIAVPGLILSD